MLLTVVVLIVKWYLLLTVSFECNTDVHFLLTIASWSDFEESHFACPP